MPANGNAKFVNAELKAQASHEAQLAGLKAAVELAKASDDPQVYENAVIQLREAVQAHFTEISALRKATAVAKAPLVAAHVAEIVEETGAKVVVFTHHHEVTDLLIDELSDLGVVKLDGRISMESRNLVVNAFQNDEAIKIFVGSIQAAGVGLTLTESAHVVFAELDWVPGNIRQAEDRCHRIGQTDSVLVQMLVLEESIDAKLAKTFVRKQAIIDKALDAEPDADPEADEPIIVEETPSISPRKSEIETVAAKLTAEDIAEIHTQLKFLSAMCDGANAIDGMGFNKIDTRIGKSLAAYHQLTPKQAALGQKLTRKYRRQLNCD